MDLEEYVAGRKIVGKRPHWEVAYRNIKHRCENKNDVRFDYYGGRGIKCLVTPAMLKAAFIRDSAWNLERPSIDRKNSDGNYSRGNIRWIEFIQNIR
jgi:hypothetical protein